MIDQRSVEVASVVETLRFLAGGWIHGEDDRQWLLEVAEKLESGAVAEDVCCPLCAEITCDDDCPLRRAPRRR